MMTPSTMRIMPCGHPSKLLGHSVRVCAFDCDVVMLPLSPRCARCGSTNLAKHSFGNDAFGQWHNTKLPDAVICEDCKHVMHYGGVR